MKTTRTTKQPKPTKPASAAGYPEGIPPPQVLAMKVYTQMVSEGAGKVKPEQTAALIKDGLTAAVECACKAQRMADALLIEVIADQRIPLGDKDFGAYLCGVLRGTIDPKQDLGRASDLVKAGLL